MRADFLYERYNDGVKSFWRQKAVFTVVSDEEWNAYNNMRADFLYERYNDGVKSFRRQKVGYFEAA